jgi:uncharacterized protein YecE (DUF72 family)
MESQKYTSISKVPPVYADLLRIGTCSWKYADWKGLIYDPAKSYKPGDYLPDYAAHYNTVEIDQWFWSLFAAAVKLPDPQTAQTYTDSVPDDFLFTVKAPNALTLTHHYARQPTRTKACAGKPNEHFLSIDLLNKFLDALRPMHQKLGPVMFQFEYLNKQKMPSLSAFLDRLAPLLAAAPKQFEYALEIRNPNYLKPEYFAFLKEHNLDPVLIDGYYMPPIRQIADTFDLSAGRTLIIRLMGPDRQKIEQKTGNKWDTIVAPADARLADLAEILKDRVQHKKPVIVNVNNHYEGCAPITIDRLITMLHH